MGLSVPMSLNMLCIGATMSDVVKKSKFLSLILRHKPEEIGLKLDSSGWAIVSELCKLAHISKSELDEVVSTNNKKRFEYNEDKSKIRACQGHSINVDLGLAPSIPPDSLYHGTATRFVNSILRSGLIAGSRDYVHMSINVDTAINVGSRHGKPVVFLVKAGEMVKDGFEFFLSNNGVWLTKSVPPKYLELSCFLKTI
jgi:putative RNA 2'-phosphotransferase